MDQVKFTDLFTGKPRSEEEVAQERLSICEKCDHYINLTTQCKKCGCVMKLKTKLEQASCPIGKW